MTLTGQHGVHTYVTKGASLPRGARGIVAGLAAACAILLTGCVPQGLAFRVDNRLAITSPKDGAEVTVPLTVTWTIRDFTVDKSAPAGAKDTGYFAVFVDRAPQPPGKSLAWIARKD